ncbi:MAG: macro domain-containing protein [bacterium]
MCKKYLLVLLLTLNIPLLCSTTTENAVTPELVTPENITISNPTQPQISLTNVLCASESQIQTTIEEQTNKTEEEAQTQPKVPGQELEPPCYKILPDIETTLNAVIKIILAKLDLKTKPVITLVCGDLVKQSFQDHSHAAIVNAANRALIGGSGITGAIWKASGGLTGICDDELNKQKNALKTELIGKYAHLKIGEAVITESQKLKNEKIVDWVLHTPGPDCRYKNQNDNRKVYLTNAYINCLKVADENDIQTVTFPSISTGIFRYPFDEARDCALETVIQYLNENYTTTKIKEVRFVLWDAIQFDAYLAKLTALTDLNKLSAITDINPFLINSSKINAPIPRTFQIK